MCSIRNPLVQPPRRPHKATQPRARQFVDTQFTPSTSLRCSLPHGGLYAATASQGPLAGFHCTSLFSTLHPRCHRPLWRLSPPCVVIGCPSGRARFPCNGSYLRQRLRGPLSRSSPCKAYASSGWCGPLGVPCFCGRSPEQEQDRIRQGPRVVLREVLAGQRGCVQHVLGHALHCLLRRLHRSEIDRDGMKSITKNCILLNHGTPHR